MTAFAEREPIRRVVWGGLGYFLCVLFAKLTVANAVGERKPTRRDVCGGLLYEFWLPLARLTMPSFLKARLYERKKLCWKMELALFNLLNNTSN